jgi:hypothetical protein
VEEEVGEEEDETISLNNTDVPTAGFPSWLACQPRGLHCN